jgi:hypothetical protein
MPVMIMPVMMAVSNDHYNLCLSLRRRINAGEHEQHCKSQ